MAWQAFVALLVAWALVLTLCLRVLRRATTRDWLHEIRQIAARLTAERRANALVRATLSPRQYRQLQRRGFVEVTSPSIPQRVYRIPGAGGLVRVYEGGHAIMDLCVQPVDALPDGDVILLHKLMIEGAEQEYLAKANHFAPGIIPVRMSYR